MELIVTLTKYIQKGHFNFECSQISTHWNFAWIYRAKQVNLYGHWKRQHRVSVGVLEKSRLRYRGQSTLYWRNCAFYQAFEQKHSISGERKLTVLFLALVKVFFITHCQTFLDTAWLWYWWICISSSWFIDCFSFWWSTVFIEFFSKPLFDRCLFYCVWSKPEGE